MLWYYYPFISFFWAVPITNDIGQQSNFNNDLYKQVAISPPASISDPIFTVEIDNENRPIYEESAKANAESLDENEDRSDRITITVHKSLDSTISNLNR